MKTFRPFSQLFLARAFLPALIGGLALSLAGCDRSADSASPAKTTASKATAAASGITLQGEGVAIDAPAATALLGGYSTEPLSFRIMSGWVDQEKIKLANQETDPAEKRKKAMGTFGTVTLQIAAVQAAPGSYQLAPQAGAPQTGTVILDAAKGAGIAHDYTSQSGTLTIQSVTMNDTGKQVKAVAGTFDGQFHSDQGDSRAFSGSFRFIP